MLTAQWNLVSNVKNFDYTGGQQTFTAPYTGYYKLETWGAQGGQAYNSTYYGGYGGYSVGIYNTVKNKTIYVNVGGKGVDASSIDVSIFGGYNGGGANGIHGGGSSRTGSGGGATHIATVSGQLKNLSSYKDTGGSNVSREILIVAGAGSGAAYSSCCGMVSGANGGGFSANHGVSGAFGDNGKAYQGGCGGGQNGTESEVLKSDESRLCGHCAKPLAGFGYGSGGNQSCFGGGGGGGGMVVSRAVVLQAVAVPVTSALQISSLVSESQNI